MSKELTWEEIKELERKIHILNEEKRIKMSKSERLYLLRILNKL